ncbi:uncharacterized protein IUM83_09567 [Phytophthora cinnamomi]|uniref:uncharacterized protein n=1 Tax=Phytophthora cinnamomi TaxID=4785 RepID=UPI003559962C|nr:hypothetical protein IUM83_09567 [Phytophthora cinnamomi]
MAHRSQATSEEARGLQSGDGTAATPRLRSTNTTKTAELQSGDDAAATPWMRATNASTAWSQAGDGDYEHSESARNAAQATECPGATTVTSAADEERDQPGTDEADAKGRECNCVVSDGVPGRVVADTRVILTKRGFDTRCEMAKKAVTAAVTK